MIAPSEQLAQNLEIHAAIVTKQSNSVNGKRPRPGTLHRRLRAFRQGLCKVRHVEGRTARFDGGE
jgi:hypothetical protein